MRQERRSRFAFGIVLGSLVVPPPTARADCPTVTSDGAEFVLTFPISEGSVGEANRALLVVMTTEPAQVRVTIPACGAPVVLNPTPTVPATLQVCEAAEFVGMGPSGGFMIEVKRTDSPGWSLQVVMKLRDPAGTSDDAFLVLPKDRLGESYHVMGYRGFDLGGGTGSPSRWAVVAPADIDLTYRDCDDNIQGPIPLAAGEVFQQKCDLTKPRKDGSGSRISAGAGQKFALIGGSQVSQIPQGLWNGDTLAEMMPPENWAGTEIS